MYKKYYYKFLIIGFLLAVFAISFCFLSDIHSKTKVMMEPQYYNLLPVHQKEFLSKVFRQDFNTGNHLPIGAAYLNDDFFKISVEEVSGDDLGILVTLMFKKISDLKEDKIIVLQNSEQWKYIESPVIKLYKKDGSVDVIEGASFVTFSGAEFEINSKDVSKATVYLTCEPNRKQAQRKILVGYIHKQGLRIPIRLSYEGNPIERNMKTKWTILDW